MTTGTAPLTDYAAMVRELAQRPGEWAWVESTSVKGARQVARRMRYGRIAAFAAWLEDGQVETRVTLNRVYVRLVNPVHKV